MSCELIHYADWAQQPDVHLLCCDIYGVPSWGQSAPLPIDVYVLDFHRKEDGKQDQALYSFDEDKVTCEECLRKMMLSK